MHPLFANELLLRNSAYTGHDATAPFIFTAISIILHINSTPGT
jgi:hypothetical protein